MTLPAPIPCGTPVRFIRETWHVRARYRRPDGDVYFLINADGSETSAMAPGSDLGCTGRNVAGFWCERTPGHDGLHWNCVRGAVCEWHSVSPALARAVRRLGARP